MPALSKLRTLAFHAQQGRCCYCRCRMWLTAPDELKPFGIRPSTAQPLRCTAEHLQARQNGGRDTAPNIGAACWLCNQRRHRRKSPPEPDAYRAHVLKRLAKGKWHARDVLRALSP